MNILLRNFLVACAFSGSASVCFGIDETVVNFEFEIIDAWAGCVSSPEEMQGLYWDGQFAAPGASFELTADEPLHNYPPCSYYGKSKKIPITVRDNELLWVSYSRLDSPFGVHGTFKFIPPEWATTVKLDAHKSNPSSFYTFIKTADGKWSNGFHEPEESIYWLIFDSAADPEWDGVNSIKVLSGCNSCTTCSDGQESSDYTPQIQSQSSGPPHLSSKLSFKRKCCDQPSSSARMSWLPTNLADATNPLSIRATSSNSEISYALANATAYRFPRDRYQAIQQVKVGESLGVVIKETPTSPLIWRFYDATGIGQPTAAGEYPLTKTDNTPLPLLEEVIITQENLTSVRYERRVNGVLIHQSRLTHDTAVNSWQNEDFLAGSRKRLTKTAHGDQARESKESR